ncbi:MAG: hypothetical protein KC445_07150, partial [Anaerolineales bacterium]|nr:hypothetical protein [Anaerolineales bacterium]
MTESVSPALAAANARLLMLRAELGVQTREYSPIAPSLAVSEELHQAQEHLTTYRQQVAAVGQGCPLSPTDTSWVQELAQRLPSPTIYEPPLPALPAAETLILHPTLATTLLGHELAAAGRIYFLLRHLDTTNQGWVTVETARAQLTDPNAPLRVCGWRRLRQLLKDGEGVLWQRDNDRLWLTGAAKIAHKLGCQRLTGQAVEIPIKALLGGIQQVRAHFYASFHSGREAAPISRQTLHTVTSVPERTQRLYDDVAQIKSQTNLAIGEKHSPFNQEERYWQQGSGVFHFLDTNGQQGAANGEYLAWQLPNSYQGPHQPHGQRSRKRLNQQLADLRKKVAEGNDKSKIGRVFWSDGATATRAFSRNATHDQYWPQSADASSSAQL